MSSTTASITPASAPSWADLLSGRNALRSIALAGGVALHAINVYIVTTILPTIIGEIGGLEYFAWNTTLFVVTSIVGSALAAKLLEISGPRRAYLLALLVFALGSTLCALAPTMPALLAGRSLQGLGGGLLFALSYALIRIVFEQPLWPRAMALISGMWGIATLCGPAIGGVFAQPGQWRWAFGALLPIAGLLALIVMGQLQKKTDETSPGSRVPTLKIVLLVTSVVAISVASLSDSLAINVACIAMGLAVAMLIVRLDSHGATRLLPTGAYSLSRPLGRLYALMALIVAAIMTEIFVPYFLQVIHGHTPLISGYMSAVMAAGWTLAAIYSASRTGRKADGMISSGPVVILLSLAALAVMTPMVALLETLFGLVAYCVALAGVGFGIGMAWPHLLMRVFTSAQAGEENLASSSTTTVQLYAMAVGAALAGVVVNSAGLTDPGGIIGAQHASRWLFGAFAIAPAVAVWLARRVVRQ